MVRTPKPTAVARYALFGEQLTDDDPEFIHIEEIQTRSRLYAWRITPHVHQRMFQIVYVLSGPVAVNMEGQARELAGPCAITVPGGAVHSFVFSADTVGYVVSAADRVVLDAHRLRGQPSLEAILSAPLIVDFAASPAAAMQLSLILREMMNEFSGSQPGRAAMIDSMLRIVALTVARQAHAEAAARGPRSYARETFQRFARLVEEKYRAHWPVKEYAAALALSPARLNRLCLAFAGKGTQEIIHARLALEAQRLLTYTSATTAMVAYEIGFEDPAYFTRFFRKRTGLTPGAFRDRAGGIAAAP